MVNEDYFCIQLCKIQATDSKYEMFCIQSSVFGIVNCWFYMHQLGVTGCFGNLGEASGTTLMSSSFLSHFSLLNVVSLRDCLYHSLVILFLLYI